MDLLENIKIRNFRGFDEKGIEIDGLSKFNVFVGKNNCGKTSVLEAIFLLANLKNRFAANHLNGIRGISDNDSHNLKYLFHNNIFNNGNNPVITGKMSGNTERNLKIIPVIDQDTNEVYSYDTKKAVLKSVDFEGNGAEDMPLIYIPTCPSHKLLVDGLSVVFKENNENIIINELNKFDGRIKSVSIIQNDIYCSVDGISEKVKIEMLGDGAYRFLSAIVPMIVKKSRHLCIDEIENGLHYTSQKLLLKSLLKFSESNNVQLFITTHNIEILKNLSEVLEEDEMASMQDFTKIFDIAKTLKAGFQSYKYSFDGFKILLENETEIRE